jgi:hypothetical protein
MTAEGQPFSFTPLARGQHPKGRVFGQPLGIVDVLVVARRLSMDWRKRSGSGNCRLRPVARISEVDQCAQPQALVQLAREQEAGIGGHHAAGTRREVED